ncbi:FKBP-type peptidyl-prolyl cis-trans isomerase [Microbacterium aerolatum]|uniref:FKBP-type peptidyl-prolyl cis-trans isomerase n=1 Tax=Microbacterium aerolatum TaxID=153731 RepID=UPI002000C726|nr:FKBP-type peptidyl-prolyl cis-trans isomerase [Microbacterium aerolatum]MCK3768218.1 FKBP-type peptidyl-prolyl cis-trans isomerase [Microbacterium aerolatum]
MRKSSAALATLALASVALTGCAAGPSFDGAACDRAASSSGIEDLANITGDVGSKPDVELFTPIGGQSSTFGDVVVGSGPALTSSTQSAVFEFSLFSGETGEPVAATAYDEDRAQLASVGYWAQTVPAFGNALECATEGSRVLAVVSPEDFGAQNLSSFGLEADEPVVAVFDVVRTFPSRAEGALQYNDASGMPTVVRAPDGRPGIIVPDGDAPIELEVQTLIKGDGPTVAEDDTLLVNYTGVTWNDREVFDSSWDRGAATFDLANLIPGFTQGLTGQTVGSQVLIVVPPELGYGEQGSGAVPANATLVFVVDILGIDPPASSQQ